MNAIKRFFTSRMGHGALSMVEEGKQMPKDIIESSQKH